MEMTQRIVCRYGAGCTHTDYQHKEQYWHPAKKDFSREQYHTHYICNECGDGFLNLANLQIHLKRKTAWSDISLVGCRVSCLVDSKEWHEGFVRSLSRQGKHCVEFHLSREKRWLNMTRIAFYIAERPQLSATLLCGEVNSTDPKLDDSMENGTSRLVQHRDNTSSSDEYKDDYELSDNESNLAPIDDMDQWVYVEDISLDYAFVQSVLFKITGGSIQETGHKTKGHACLTEGDKYISKLPDAKGSLLYGELLPRGANKAFGSSHLNAANAKVLFDLGMGTGKIAIQAFLQFRNLEYVYGVELSEGRFKVAEEYVRRMVQLLGPELYTIDTLDEGRRLVVTEAATIKGVKSRVLEFQCGDMFAVQNIHVADIVMMETDIPTALHSELCNFLNEMHPGARTLSYLDLRKVWHFQPFTFKQLDVNRHLSDRYPTSWSVQRGHHFFLWTKVTTAKLVGKLVSDPAQGGDKKRFSSGKFFCSASSSSSASASGGGRGSTFAVRSNKHDEDLEGTSTSFAEYFSRCTPHNLYSSLSSMFSSRRSSRKKSRKSRVGSTPSSLFGLAGAAPAGDKICPEDDASQGSAAVTEDATVAAAASGAGNSGYRRKSDGPSRSGGGSDSDLDEAQASSTGCSSLSVSVPVASGVVEDRMGSPGGGRDDESTAYPSPTTGVMGSGAQLPLSERMLQTPSSSPVREGGKTYQAGSSSSSSSSSSGSTTSVANTHANADEQHLLESHTSPVSGRLHIGPEAGEGRSPNLAWAIPSKAGGVGGVIGRGSGGGVPALLSSSSSSLAAPTDASFGDPPAPADMARVSPQAPSEGSAPDGSAMSTKTAPSLSEDVPGAMATIVNMAASNVVAASVRVPSSSMGGGVQAGADAASSGGSGDQADVDLSQTSKMAGYSAGAGRATSLGGDYVNSSSFVEVYFNTSRITETATEGDGAAIGVGHSHGSMEVQTAAVASTGSSDMDAVRSFRDMGDTSGSTDADAGAGAGAGAGAEVNLAASKDAEYLFAP